MYQLHACMYLYIHITWSAWQANSKNSTGSVHLKINLLKPTRIEFAENPAPSISLPNGPHFPPKWLKYVYRDVSNVPPKSAIWPVHNFPETANKNQITSLFFKKI